MFKEALDRFDRIDTLVNNAGMFMAKPFTAYSKDDYAAYIATNVTGFFHMTQLALELGLRIVYTAPYMGVYRGGRIRLLRSDRCSSRKGANTISSIRLASPP